MWFIDIHTIPRVHHSAEIQLDILLEFTEVYVNNVHTIPDWSLVQCSPAQETCPLSDEQCEQWPEQSRIE